MDVVVAIDSLKGSLSSMEAGNFIAQGITHVIPEAAVHVRPLADGGEGTVEALTRGMGGTFHRTSVTGPLGTPVEAVYGILPNSRNLRKGNTAIIEMSAAAGLPLVPEADRNPLYTTTFGVGEMIRDAIKHRCRHFLVGIGGSATNDGGIGMLQALGFGILDEEDRPVPFGARGLQQIKKITDNSVIPELHDCTFRIACDVSNPLCGDQGSSAVFGPQKGANPAMIAQMDRGLAYFAALSRMRFPHGDPDHPGAGAAGGLGFAFLTYTNATLESGIQIVLEETRLEDYVRSADIVITGEGRLDRQTAMGKAPIGVAMTAKRYGKPVIAFSGCADDDAVICNEHGIDAYFPILQNPGSLQEMMRPEVAGKNLRATTEQVFRLVQYFTRLSR